MDPMRTVRRLLRRLRALLFRSRFEREMDEEMRFHLEMEIEDRVRGGMTPEEARRSALRDFGRVENHKEDARAARGLRAWDELSQDARFGARVLARRPGFTALAVLTLGAGIAAATTVFALANAVLYRPVPGLVEQERLAQLRFRAPHLEDEESGLSALNLRDLAAMDLPAVSHLTGWAGPHLQVAVPGGATGLFEGAAVTGDYFAALGVRASAGRLFGGPEAEASEPVVVLSARARRALFGDAEAVGRTLRVNGNLLTVVGVAGGGFRGISRGGDADLWVPYGIYARLRHFGAAYAPERGSSGLHDFVLRLAPGATLAGAEAQLREGMERLVAAYPEENDRYADYRPTLFREIGISPFRVERTRETLRLLLGAVSLVLLIACANVANLLIFRGVRRRGESAVRQAMGASRPRLVRQHLTESGMLAAGGVVVGLAAALGLMRLFVGVPLPGLPPLDAVPLDGRVLAFAVAAGAATVLLAGLVPAVVVHRIDLARALKDASATETGRKRRLRAGLTMVQLALSLALLVGTLLLVQTLRNLQGVDLGFDPRGVVAVRIDPDPQGYDEERANLFQAELLRAAGEIPGVTAVGAAEAGPLSVTSRVDLRAGDAAVEGWPVEAWGDMVSPGYFGALGVPLLHGRTFTPAELEASWAQTSDVAVVNETLARRLFGSPEAAPGRRLEERGYLENRTLRVVGVVGDSRVRDLGAPAEAALYRPLGEHYSNGVVLVVRSAGPPEEVVAAVREAVDRLDPALPFYEAVTIPEKVAEETMEQSFLAKLMSVLAALAALLAGVGLYGVVAYSVAERTREIGVRMALGARGWDVVALVLRQSLLLTAVGVVAGVGAAWMLARLLESRLYGVEPLDPGAWLAAVGAFLLVALLAAAAPARAAVRVDPVRALKA